MIPVDLHRVFKKSLLSKFDAEPLYDEILASLKMCFEKALDLTKPVCPPSMSQNGAAGSSAAESQHYQYQQSTYKSYVFEWKRTMANRVRDAIISQNNGMDKDEEVALTPQPNNGIADALNASREESKSHSGLSISMKSGSNKDILSNHEGSHS